jgi:hypothetical protein
LTGLQDRRRRGIRASLARLAFSIAKKLAGEYLPRQYAYYAAIVPLDAVDLTMHKVEAGGSIEPDTHRDALYHLAQEVGNVRREQVISRLAMDDAGILLLTPEERLRLVRLYNVQEG